MGYPAKTLISTFIFSLMIVLLPLKAMTQQFIPTTRTIQTPVGPAKIVDHHIIGAPHYFGGVKKPSKSQSAYSGHVAYPFILGKIDMTVVLQSDSVFNGRLLFKVYDSVHSLTLERKKKEGGNRIYVPKDTKQISQLYKGRLIVGIPADSCWLFKVDEGKISSYAPFPTDVIEYYTAIQKNGEPILPLTIENLKDMIGDNSKLIKLVDKGKVSQAIWKYNNGTKKNE